MNPKELRIGNLLTDIVWGGHGEVQGIELIKDGFKLKLKDHIHIFKPNHRVDVEPIPITEEWLKRLGFFYNGSTWQNKADDTNSEWTFKNGRIDRYDDFEYETSTIKYVHQLQNKFYYETHEELELAISDEQ